MRDFRVSLGGYEITGRIREWEDLDEFSRQSIIDDGAGGGTYREFQFSGIRGEATSRC